MTLSDALYGEVGRGESNEEDQNISICFIQYPEFVVLDACISFGGF